jgi:hypothetical protein
MKRVIRQANLYEEGREFESRRPSFSRCGPVPVLTRRNTSRLTMSSPHDKVMTTTCRQFSRNGVRDDEAGARIGFLSPAKKPESLIHPTVSGSLCASRCLSRQSTSRP